MATETALITGASSGIGLELAKLFAADKSNLVLVARSQERLEHLAAQLRQDHGIEAAALAQDLADPAAPQRIFDQLTGQGAQVDVLVNNAGFGGAGRFAELPLQRQIDMVQVNVAALTRLTRLFLPAMIERRRGGVLNLGSTAGFQPGPFGAVYFATKAFVVSFTEALADELGGTGVTATCLAPGATATGFATAAGMDRSLLFRLPVMDAETVARAGYRAFRRGKVLVVPGILNRLSTFSVRLTPRFLVRKIARWLQAPG